MFGLVFSLAQSILPGLFKIIDDAVEDKDEANRLKSELQMRMLSNQMEEFNAAARVVLAEAQGESWLQRNWRPLLMLLVTVILANNFLLAPYIQAYVGHAISLPLPADLWNLLTIGVGGYVVGRSAEKVADRLGSRGQ